MSDCFDHFADAFDDLLFGRTAEGLVDEEPAMKTRKEKYVCTTCGHVQVVTVVLAHGGEYVGSAAQWCNACADGKPEPIAVIKRTDNAGKNNG